MTSFAELSVSLEIYQYFFVDAPGLTVETTCITQNTELLSLTLDLFFKILLFQVAFLKFFSITIFSPYFLLVGLLLQSVTLFQSRQLVKYLK